MAEGYLRPKQGAHTLGKRKMEEGIFRNPPTYTEFGGFSSSGKYTDPSGRRQKIGGPSLERGGPSAVKGKPI
jgi:hypothetical protein